MSKLYELQRRYFVYWNGVLQFNLSSHSEHPEQRAQANEEWGLATGSSIGLKRVDQLVDKLIQIYSDPSQTMTMRARAIFCLLWPDLRLGYCDQINGPLIAKHLGICGLPQYLIAENKQIPWGEIPHELEQFVIETIILSLQHLQKNAEELKQWYGTQLILFAGQKENRLALEFLPEHFKVFEIWERFLIRQDISEEMKRPANQQLMDFLRSSMICYIKEAQTPICQFTSMVYNRLNDRQRGMGYHPAILYDQVCFIMQICEEFPQFAKGVRVYLPQETYYWMLCCLDQLDQSTQAYKITRKRLVEFFVAGGVYPPNTETGYKAVRMMREIALQEQWLDPIIALGLALGMSPFDAQAPATAQ